MDPLFVSTKAAEAAVRGVRIGQDLLQLAIEAPSALRQINRISQAFLDLNVALFNLSHVLGGTPSAADSSLSSSSLLPPPPSLSSSPPGRLISAVFLQRICNLVARIDNVQRAFGRKISTGTNAGALQKQNKITSSKLGRLKAIFPGSKAAERLAEIDWIKNTLSLITVAVELVVLGRADCRHQNEDPATAEDESDSPATSQRRGVRKQAGPDATQKQTSTTRATRDRSRRMTAEALAGAVVVFAHSTGQKRFEEDDEDDEDDEDRSSIFDETSPKDNGSRLFAARYHSRSFLHKQKATAATQGQQQQQQLLPSVDAADLIFQYIGSRLLIGKKKPSKAPAPLSLASEIVDWLLCELVESQPQGDVGTATEPTETVEQSQTPAKTQPEAPSMDSNLDGETSRQKSVDSGSPAGQEERSEDTITVDVPLPPNEKMARACDEEKCSQAAVWQAVSQAPKDDDPEEGSPSLEADPGDDQHITETGNNEDNKVDDPSLKNKEEQHDDKADAPKDAIATGGETPQADVHKASDNSQIPAKDAAQQDDAPSDGVQKDEVEVAAAFAIKDETREPARDKSHQDQETDRDSPPPPYPLPDPFMAAGRGPFAGAGYFPYQQAPGVFGEFVNLAYVPAAPGLFHPVGIPLHAAPYYQRSPAYGNTYMASQAAPSDQQPRGPHRYHHNSNDSYYYSSAGFIGSGNNGDNSAPQSKRSFSPRWSGTAARRPTNNFPAEHANHRVHRKGESSMAKEQPHHSQQPSRWQQNDVGDLQPERASTSDAKSRRARMEPGRSSNEQTAQHEPKKGDSGRQKEPADSHESENDAAGATVTCRGESRGGSSSVAKERSGASGHAVSHSNDGNDANIKEGQRTTVESETKRENEKGGETVTSPEPTTTAQRPDAGSLPSADKKEDTIVFTKAGEAASAEKDKGIVQYQADEQDSDQPDDSSAKGAMHDSHRDVISAANPPDRDDADAADSPTSVVSSCSTTSSAALTSLSAPQLPSLRPVRSPSPVRHGHGGSSRGKRKQEATAAAAGGAAPEIEIEIYEAEDDDAGKGGAAADKDNKGKTNRESRRWATGQDRRATTVGIDTATDTISVDNVRSHGLGDEDGQSRATLYPRPNETPPVRAPQPPRLVQEPSSRSHPVHPRRPPPQPPLHLHQSHYQHEYEHPPRPAPATRVPRPIQRAASPLISFPQMAFLPASSAPLPSPAPPARPLPQQPFQAPPLPPANTWPSGNPFEPRRGPAVVAADLHWSSPWHDPTTTAVPLDTAAILGMDMGGMGSRAGGHSERPGGAFGFSLGVQRVPIPAVAAAAAAGEARALYDGPSEAQNRGYWAAPQQQASARPLRQDLGSSGRAAVEDADEDYLEAYGSYEDRYDGRYDGRFDGRRDEQSSRWRVDMRGRDDDTARDRPHRPRGTMHRDGDGGGSSGSRLLPRLRSSSQPQFRSPQGPKDERDATADAAAGAGAGFGAGGALPERARGTGTSFAEQQQQLRARGNPAGREGSPNWHGDYRQSRGRAALDVSDVGARR